MARANPGPPRTRPTRSKDVEPHSSSKESVRVAIIGGGCAALTTAFELSRPEHNGRYQVTVYQMGWRLGGKGASGRGASDRIEEHGLHLWMGYYENAFRMIRECYEELGADGGKRRFARWDDAFTAARNAGVSDRTPDGEWEFWIAQLPPVRGLPGDPLEPGEPFTVSGYVRQAAMLVGELLRSVHSLETGRHGAPPSNGRGAERDESRQASRIENAAATVETLVGYGRLAGAAALFEATDVLRQAMETWIPEQLRENGGVLVRLIEALAAAARRALERLTSGDGQLRRIWHVIDLVLASLRGATVHGLALDPRGFDAINEYDSREWLRLHGATEDSLNSGFMRGLYDLSFAFEDGDVNRPRLAAGVGLRGALRMFFTYRGSLFFRMNAGMGDVVFAPLYEVLKRRGVRFEFFHRLRNIRLSPPTEPGLPYVRALEFDVQARVKGGGEYAPLVNVHDMPCWPATPDCSQLEGGAALKREKRAFEAHWEHRRAGGRTLKIGEDFDFVVLGISVGAVPYVARELIDRDRKWADMVRYVKTIATQSFQIWMREDVNRLGWKRAPVNLSGFEDPFDTWADMSHLIAEENWKESVKSIAYFCGVLPDVLPPGGELTEALHKAQLDQVRRDAVHSLETNVGALWPGALRSDGGFRWELLATDGATTGSRPGARCFDTQYWSANVNPSDRYVLALPGSVKYRLSPLDLTFDNLTIAGDWTSTGLETGCIESAVMSGLLAAHAISEKPALEDIVGYDHP